MRGLIVLLACGCGRVDFDTHEPLPDASLGFCASQPPSTFCSDFDSVPDFADWKTSYQAGATVTPGANAHSPPWALHASNDVLPTASDSCGGHLAQFFASGGTHAVASVDAWVGGGVQGGPVLLALQFDDGTVSHGIEYVYRAPPDTPFIEEARAMGTMPQVYNNYVVPAQMPGGEWHRITMDITLGTSPSVVVRHDAQDVLTTSLAGTTAGSVTLYAGVVYLAGPASSWQIDLDNVVLDLQ